MGGEGSVGNTEDTERNEGAEGCPQLAWQAAGIALPFDGIWGIMATG
jgi:hypothetical protein